MELDVEDRTVQREKKRTDLFNWAAAIGDFREEYDAERGAMVRRFQRAPDVQLAVKRVNKCVAAAPADPGKRLTWIAGVAVKMEGGVASGKEAGKGLGRGGRRRSFDLNLAARARRATRGRAGGPSVPRHRDHRTRQC